MFNKLLLGEDTEVMIQTACRASANNVKLLVQEGLSLLNLTAKTELKRIGLNVGEQLLAVPAHFLNRPSIFYRTGNGNSPFKQAPSIRPASWNFSNLRFFQPAQGDIPGVAVVDFRKKPIVDFSDLHPELANMLRKSGLKVSNSAKASPWISASETVRSDTSVREALTKTLLGVA